MRWSQILYDERVGKSDHGVCSKKEIARGSWSTRYGACDKQHYNSLTLTLGAPNRNRVVEWCMYSKLCV